MALPKKQKYRLLRKKYPVFVYKKYVWKISKNNLEIVFDFKIIPDIHFEPKVVIKNIDNGKIKKIGDRAMDNLVFHLGMIEAVSYWKSTCSPVIKVEAGALDNKMISWWRDLLINGLGQFFYENSIDFRAGDFLKIIAKNTKPEEAAALKLKNNILIPIGGGKDSAVTLELLKGAKKDIQCFSLNPTPAAIKTMGTGDCKEVITVTRTIDKKLLELNRKGFLNGHTPFSAYVAFLSVLLCVVFNRKYIALSNERSSNEGNVSYLGKTVNHQYSKSFDFEKKFRRYSKKYLARDAEYFSFLRPLYEIQIAKIFSRYPKYFKSFLSCNVAHQTNSGREVPLEKWCGHCPKCLFAFVILYPFIGAKANNIFGENLFEKKNLLPVMQELIGEARFKPFECVGTRKETLAAFYLSLSYYYREKSLNGAVSAPPYLLKYFEDKILPKSGNLKNNSEKMINAWNKQHRLPGVLEKILKKSIL